MKDADVRVWHNSDPANRSKAYIDQGRSRLSRFNEYTAFRAMRLAANTIKNLHASSLHQAVPSTSS
jgi:hypothetical protein